MPYLYDPLKDLDRLKELPQFQLPIDEIDAVLKYTIFLYDPESDLRKTIFDFSKRKREAVRLAGFQSSRTGGITDYAQDILLGKNLEVNCMIMDYLKLFNNPWLIKYTALWSLLDAEVLDSMNLSGMNPKERGDIRKNIKEITDEIGECEKHIFGGVDTESIRAELFATFEGGRPDRLRPEGMASSLEQKTADIGQSPFYPKIS